MLQNLEIGLQSKTHRLITPFQTVGSGALSEVLITFEVEAACIVLAIILPRWTGLLKNSFCFDLRLQDVFLLGQQSPRW